MIRITMALAAFTMEAMQVESLSIQAFAENDMANTCSLGQEGNQIFAPNFLSQSEDNNSLTKNKKCRALALSGGGSRASYMGGAIYGLIEKGSPDEDYQWDVITGASAGCMQATLMGLWPKGKEAQMAKQLVTSHDGVDWYKRWD